MILKQVTETIMNVLGRFKGVQTVKYQGNDFNNAQHNYDTLQAYVDNVQFHQFNLTTNIVKAELQIYILGFPDEENEVLDIQDKAYNCAINVLAYIDNNAEWRNIIRLHDYSILTLAEYTAQRNAGVKISLVLEIPSGVDLCELNDNFNDEPVKPEPEEELELKVIDLPISIKC